MKRNGRKTKENVGNKKIVLAVFSILFILYLVMAYMLIHSRTIASLEAEKSVIEKLYVVIERNKDSIQEHNSHLKTEFIIRASSVALLVESDEEYERNPEKLQALADILMVDEIHLFSSSGVIYGGTRPEYYGYSLYSGEQMGFFIPMLSDTSLSLCQDIVPNTAEGKLMMYAMVWRSDHKGMVQIGVSPKRLAYEMNENEVLSLVESMPVTQGRKLFVSDRASNLIIGATDSSFLGESLESLGIEERKEKGLYQGFERVNGEYSIVSSYFGDNFSILVTQSLVNAYMNVWGTLVILLFFVIVVTFFINYVIITYNKRLSKERDERLKENEARNKELSIALHDAESASRSKSAFLMNMSHDIRTPMNAIIGFSDLLEKCQLGEEERRYVKNIKVSGRQLMNLLNGILSMTHIESGKVKLEKTPQNIYEVFDDLNVIIKERAGKKGVSFGYETQGNDCTLLMDRAKYSEILLNILSNGVKYTEKGGRVVMRNTIEERAEDTVLVTCVIEDNGIGMSPSFLPHIFESFEREAKPGVGKTEGYGIGMSITKSLVELMEGSIEVKSTQGMGTVVKVTIPFKKTKKKERKPGIVLPQWKDSPVLLVEDNDLNAEIAMLMLEDLGFVVDRAKDGNEALDMVEKKDPFFTLIFMDLLMPGLDGYETTKRIRRMKGEKSEVPIIALTANAFEEDRIKAVECGMDGHVQKPLEKEMLLKAIDSVLGV